MNSGKPIVTLKLELGRAIAAYRLSRNLRQADIAEQAGVSPGVLIRLEAGKGGTVDSLIRVVRALGWEDRITTIVPDATVNPLDPRGVKGPRKRARKPKNSEQSRKPWTWAE